ncbi:Pectin degradation repressor protein KdgR [Eubacterium callanderi]|uniref:IclR family transcriptional regulator n=1 Tax=Eubacterium callanderi TaxID=53442 RepID=UPI0029FF13C0|nr:IclR family transcriptional regulator [Eubacterium callanderi]WPK69178.1 Pectin degradation repressor protein KdgR [Eubacterium callanderi]WPK73476.1 Pectin degradation repressor protein KdgR [Eubacterium callanderi]
MDTANTYKPLVKALDKGLDILECFFHNKEELGILEISKCVDANESTVYRMVKTLEEKGYLLQNANNKKYRLGFQMLDISGCTIFNKKLIDIIYKYMKKVYEATNETINFAFRANNSVVYLCKIDSTDMLRPNFIVGEKYPTYCTSLGKVLLSELSNEEVRDLFTEPLYQYTENTIKTSEDLIQELDRVRELDYAVDNEEFSVGIYCMGIPVRVNCLGPKSVGAISIPLPTVRLHKKEKILDLLLDIKEQIQNEVKNI